MSAGFWKLIFGLADRALTRERWRSELAEVYPWMEGCLEKTGRPVRHIKSVACGRNHKVVPDEEGDGFVSVCGVEGGCESRPMTIDEARGWILSGKALGELVGRVLPVTVRMRAIGTHGVWEIGIAWLKDGGKKAVLVALAGKPAGLEVGLADLFEQGLRDFVLLVADSQWCGSALGARLAAVGGEAYGLDECVEMRDGEAVRGALADKLFADGPQADKPNEMPVEEWRNAGLTVLLLLAQAYYKLLESAVRNSCVAMDMDLNGVYLWTVTNLQSILKNHSELADFPGTFEPAFEDLSPSSVQDVDWRDMVAPDAERFLCTVQQYVMSKGTYPPKEGTAAWIFVETFQSSVKHALEVGDSYSKRMAQEFAKMLKHAGKGGTAGVAPAEATAPSATASQETKGANSLADLAIGTLFVPREMLWNGESFIIEEQPVCVDGYNLNEHSLEDYFPELHDDYETYIRDVPSDEVKFLRILRLVGYEKTISVHLMLKAAEAFSPDRVESTGSTDGWHASGVLVADGRNIPIKGIRVEPTAPEVQAQIAVFRRARDPAGGGRGAPAVIEGVGDVTREAGSRSRELSREALEECTLRERGTKARKQGRRTRRVRKWAIRFKGDEFDLPDNVGTEYLVFLLTHPREEFRADELVTALNGGHAGDVKAGEVEDFVRDDDGNATAGMRDLPDSGDERVSRKTIETSTGRAKELKQLIAEGERDPGQASDVEEWKEELEKINKYLVQNTKFHGKKVVSRHFETGAYRKQSNLISKHMNGVLECIKEHDADLWKYLTDKCVLMFGSKNIYTGADVGKWRMI